MSTTHHCPCGSTNGPTGRSPKKRWSWFSAAQSIRSARCSTMTLSCSSLRPSSAPRCLLRRHPNPSVRICAVQERCQFAGWMLRTDRQKKNALPRRLTLTSWVEEGGRRRARKRSRRPRSHCPPRIPDRDEEENFCGVRILHINQIWAPYNFEGLIGDW